MSSLSEMFDKFMQSIEMEPVLFVLLAVLFLTLLAAFVLIKQRKKPEKLAPPSQELPKPSDASLKAETKKVLPTESSSPIQAKAPEALKVARIEKSADERAVLKTPAAPLPVSEQKSKEALLKVEVLKSEEAPLEIETVKPKEALPKVEVAKPEPPLKAESASVEATLLKGEALKPEKALPKAVETKPQEIVPKVVKAKLETKKVTLEPLPVKAAPVPPEVLAPSAQVLVPEAPKKALGSALKNTRSGFMAKLASLFSRGSTISDQDFEELEAILFTADIGAKTAQKLLDALRARVKADKLTDKAAIRHALKEEMRAIFERAPKKNGAMHEAPAVYMFVGVNGAGKTTSIGKLGAQMAATGKKVIFGAGDTFRAAAVTQLSIWGERSHIPVVTGKENADSAAVLFDAIAQAKAAQADVVLCDTAGRLHTKVGLMDELKKVHKVIGKAREGAPHEVFLVIDATMGQNAIAQAREFAEATPLTGVVLSKLDGTAKGGVALGIVDELGVPIRFVGVGESNDDLRPFDADEFVDALFSEN